LEVGMDVRKQRKEHEAIVPFLARALTTGPRTPSTVRGPTRPESRGVADPGGEDARVEPQASAAGGIVPAGLPDVQLSADHAVRPPGDGPGRAAALCLSLRSLGAADRAGGARRGAPRLAHAARLGRRP